jgi:hypothetical protein
VLSIRAHRCWPDRVIRFAPAARVFHQVTPERVRTRYFARRCCGEGGSKAGVSRRAGTGASLFEEARYTAVTPSRGVLRGLGDAASRRDPDGLRRALAVVAGLAVTSAGEVVGRLSPRRATGGGLL